jgi:hypothetical protein
MTAAEREASPKSYAPAFVLSQNRDSFECMIRITDENQLLDTFRALDREHVQLPSHGLEFPLALRDYVSWTEPSGHRAFLVFNDPANGMPKGIVFTRSRGLSDVPASMCEWCHSVRGGNLVALLTAASAKNRRVGVNVCADLDCKHQLEETPGVNDLRESLEPHEKRRRLLERIARFAQRNLF